MADAVYVAMIAGVVALAVSYVNNFIAESYRRFHKGSALAASLAGELASYGPAFPILNSQLDTLIAAIDARQPRIPLRPIERPTDFVFPAVVEDLGLLGAGLAENVVYVYGNLRGFRAAMEVMHRDGKEMEDQELRVRTVNCKVALNRAANGAKQLVKELRERSEQVYIPWPLAGLRRAVKRIE